MKYLNHTDHLANDIRKKGGLTIDWPSLANAYFRGENTRERILAWAAKEKIHASSNYSIQTATGGVIESVHFAPIRDHSS